MARFVVLKQGSNYTVFDFDGSIARVGGSDNVDLKLAGLDNNEDLCYLTKSSSGYEIEPRHSSVSIFINGEQISGRRLLSEGDKITFSNFLIIVSYQTAEENTMTWQSEKQVKPQAIEPTKPEPRVPSTPAPPPPERDAATRIISTPPPEPPPQTLPSTVEPLKPEVMPSPPSAHIEPAPENIPATPKPATIDAETRILTNGDITDSPKAAMPSKPTFTPVYSLVGLSGQHKGKVLPIDAAEFTVGREQGCNLVIDRDAKGKKENAISRRHFVISNADDGLYLTDRGSKLRTYVNGRVLETDQREFIAPEDIISIPAPSGEIKLRLCFAGEENFVPDRQNGSTRLLWILIVSIVALIVILYLLWKG